MYIQVPDNVSLDEAATVCATVVTAVLAFYNRRQVASFKSLGLTPFWEEGGRGKYTGEPMVIFGGATSVGQHGMSQNLLFYSSG